ncbi:MAG: tRNA (guanosine(37)-N1)-methyltransferase TrmD [Chloroflexi bacterium]|nr:tRNA (guanosine(37)-N1)-methyltransferase TrmD [Chloroflexota bacterium]
MDIHVLTLFPELFPGPLAVSVTGRALKQGLLRLHVRNIRDFAHDRHQVCDDYAYGGGPGMVMKPEPVAEAVEAAKATLGEKADQAPIVLLTPQGRPFTQKVGQELARSPALVLICGHYEGVDERVRERVATDEISIGDYVLTGGELAALVVIDAVARHVPGVLGNEESAATDSFAGGLLQYPQYTRPADYRGWLVPDVLLSGNHAEIARWRRHQSLLRTLLRRPDLLPRAELTKEDLRFLNEHGWAPQGP